MKLIPETKENNKLLSIPILIPVFMFLLITAAVLLLAVGREGKMEAQRIPLLDSSGTAKFCGENGDDAACLICYDGEDENSLQLAENTAEILDGMQVTYRKKDLSTGYPDLSSCSSLFLCTGQLSGLGKDISVLAEWLETGDFLWLCMPEQTSELRMIYRKLGITELGEDFISPVNDLVFEDDFIPGLENIDGTGLDAGDICLSLELEENCQVHVRDAETRTPLIWSLERENGSSCIVFNNNLMFEQHNYTGMIAAAYTATKELTVWPVINALAMFLDDFPAPQPEGYDERLKEQFGYTTQSFYMNIWWPDMKKLGEKYGLKYSGVLIEVYNENTRAPYAEGTADTLLQYYGAELLNNGGEIGLHGYNHMPLIPEGYPTADDYRGWPDTGEMAAALTELNRYAKKLFPEAGFTLYVPPSNNLSEEGYETLKASEPQLRVVSGVYYGDGLGAYQTSFTETADGIVQVPRVSTGCSASTGDIVRLYSVLYSQGVFSHFIHPDDVLDVDRGAELGWEKLYQELDQLLAGVAGTYGSLRGLTATSAAGAVQRCERLRVETAEKETGVELNLTGLADEAWLAFSCPGKLPEIISGGELYPVSEGFYWIRCTGDRVEIRWKEGV